MINTLIRIHDKFSLEFKIGFSAPKKGGESDSAGTNNFKINTWIFVPNGLDINRNTYTKDAFYSDIKTNVRLITPIYSLADILESENSPFVHLEKAISRLAEDANETTIEEYEYHSKMVLCIIKSALRECANSILRKKDDNQAEAIDRFCTQSGAISKRYRGLRDSILSSSDIPQKQKDFFLFGDEYLSFITEENAFLLLRRLQKTDCFEEIKPSLRACIDNEERNKQDMGYSVPSEENKEENSLILIKRSLLKKLAESDLFLQRIKKADGVFAREVYYSIAAGIAMIFATVISFAATQQFGNFTSTLFFALVISYMFKDRIKEAARIYFSAKLDQKYFDWKWNISFRNQKIGWIREAFDFISQENVPEPIQELRAKTPLVKAENQVYDEKVILYRKRVSLLNSDLEQHKEYHFPGINDIIRLNIMSFTKKMDNSEIPIHLPDESKAGFKTIMGNRAYALYFILECKSENEEYYKTYRLLFNRNGISDVLEIG